MVDLPKNYQLDFPASQPRATKTQTTLMSDFRTLLKTHTVINRSTTLIITDRVPNSG